MKKNSVIENIFAPIKYVAIGFMVTLRWIVNFMSYITLGAYYVLLYLILKPINFVLNGLLNIYYLIFTPNQVKKDKEIKIDINYDEKGEVKETRNENQKDIYTQMKENQKKKKSDQAKKKLSIKQEEKLKVEQENLLQMINDGTEQKFEKPQTYRYKALNPEGKLERGSFIGISKLDVYTFLTGEGYTVYSIETSELINFLYGQSSSLGYRMNIKNIIFFVTQLSTYIKSGITLTEAMRILSKQLNKNKNEHQCMQSIVFYLTMGESFSSALQHQVGVFPPLMINMIKAAEATGNLEETLDDLGDYYTEINSTRKQMMSAMSYPAFVGLFSMVVITIIMVKIVPQFVGIYSSIGAKLNPLTVAVIAISNFLQKNITFIFIALIAIIGIIIILYKKVKAFRIACQVLMMKIPVFGKILIYNELTVFTKTFASLLKNDVFITDSMEILRNLTTNEIYKDIMINTINNIARGEKISESFKDHWAIPDIAYYMIVTGENTGQLATMMSKVSAYYQEQHKTMVNSLKSLIEPMMIIFLAVVVGGVMIAVIMPMFELYNSIDL